MADLEEAIRVGREAIKATPVNHLDRAHYLNNLSINLGDLYNRTGAVAVLDEGIEVGREALKATPDNHPDREKNLNNLSIDLGNRYSRTGALSDLEEAIQFARQAVKALPDSNPDRAGNLQNLAIQLSNMYERTGAIINLEDAIRVGHEAIPATPDNHPNRAGYLNNLSIDLGTRYERTGAITDLEEAIQFTREAIKEMPDNHPDRAICLIDFAIDLSNLYERTGAITDLDEAIQVTREAINATPDNHPGRRYERTRAISDLEEAIQILQEIIKEIPGDHPKQATYQNNLGIQLGNRYRRTGAITDLEDAIKLLKEAIKATPGDSPSRALYLSNLSAQFNSRYSRIGAILDLEEAIRLGQEAIETTLDDHPARVRYLYNLGNHLEDKYKRTLAISYHQSALRQQNSLITIHIRAGHQVLRNLALLSDWHQCYNAADFTIHLVPQLTSRSLENSDKQHLLSAMVGLASNAASAALNAQKEALVALNLLEEGRGVLAASLEEVRVEILDLQRTYPVLAKKSAQAHRRHNANRDLDNLITKIREQPGFDRFLRAPSEEEMRLAARNGPIVIINVSQYRCDAILITNNAIRSLPLPNLKSNEIEEKAKERDLGSPRVLEWLWDNIMDPILKALEFTTLPPDNNWPHVWWIPTGPLTRLPLHAAGYHDRGKFETVLDRVMSSYSSSVKSIIHGRRRVAKQPTSTHALLIAMEHTPGNHRLPFAAKEVEILYGLCKSMSLDPIQPGELKQDIIPCLPQSRIFHFAGHGYTNDTDPLKSYLLLGDGKQDPFTVTNLLEMNLRKHSPFLAYLSACGTGRIRDDRFIDESIHLISAFQLAGFRHVIGTLWEVNDEICVDMAKITYEKLASENMTDEALCQGLHLATRELRDRSLNTLSKNRDEAKAARNAPAHLKDCKTGIGSVARKNGSPRDIVPFDTGVDGDDDINGTRELLWVPYVHYGV
ncbi:hypothetical protein BDV06DRAFT_216001 [Aspergillus oleicola]